MSDNLDQRAPSPNNNQPEDGVNPYDLPNLPESQLKILNIILRKRQISYHELVEQLDHLDNVEALQTELDDILDRLSNDGHIVWFIEGEETTYRSNLRRKSGRNLMIKGIWDVLDSASAEVDSAYSQRDSTRELLADALYKNIDDKNAGRNDIRQDAHDGKQLAADIFASAEKASKSIAKSKESLADALYGAISDDRQDETLGASDDDANSEDR